jgi:hypothetical protein
VAPNATCLITFGANLAGLPVNPFIKNQDLSKQVCKTDAYA